MRYSVRLYYDDIDEIYVAFVPELEGCMAHGKTQEDAIREIQAACELWLEEARESGMSVPEPVYQRVAV